MTTFIMPNPVTHQSKNLTQPLTIDAPSGQLFALEHLPKDEVKLCVIMLNSGMLNRCGPQRLYWAFANQVCDLGVAVVRVDLAGVGDSNAEIDETHFDNHRKEDVNAVIDYARQKWPNCQIVLQGLCAGSRVSFKSAAENESVAGLLAWSTEIFTASQNMPQSPLEPEDRLSEYEVSDTLSRLIHFVFSFKFLKPSWWRKEYPNGKGLGGDIAHTLKCIVKAVLPNKKEPVGDFLQAVDSYLKQDRKVFFAFGEYDDRAFNEFRTRFSHIEEGMTKDQSFSVIEQGTHTFSNLHSQTILFEESIKWLKQHFMQR